MSKNRIKITMSLVFLLIMIFSMQFYFFDSYINLFFMFIFAPIVIYLYVKYIFPKRDSKNK